MRVDAGRSIGKSQASIGFMNSTPVTKMYHLYMRYYTLQYYFAQVFLGYASPSGKTHGDSVIQSNVQHDFSGVFPIHPGAPTSG